MNIFRVSENVLNARALKYFFLFSRNHYAQHQQSVAAARRGASARLEDFGTSNHGAAGPADDLCGLCEA